MTQGSNSGRIVRRKLAFERDFTQLPNQWLRDERLTAAAAGWLARLMSHDVGYSITIKGLAQKYPEGVGAITTALGELQKHGYLEMRRTRNERGVIVGIEWEIFDPSKPVDNPTLPGMELSTPPDVSEKKARSEPQSGYPVVDSPVVAEPALGNPGLKEDQLKNTSNTSVKNVTTEGDVDNSPDRGMSPDLYRNAILAKCDQSPRGKHRYEPSGYCYWCAGHQDDHRVHYATGEIK